MAMAAAEMLYSKMVNSSAVRIPLKGNKPRPSNKVLTPMFMCQVYGKPHHHSNGNGAHYKDYPCPNDSILPSIPYFLKFKLQCTEMTLLQTTVAFNASLISNKLQRY